MKTSALRAVTPLLVVAAVSTFVACDDDEGGETGTGEPTTAAEEGAGSTAAPAAADVTVVLSEYVVEPEPAEFAAGDVTILADNQGSEVHELVIVEGDDPEALPTDDRGAVDEAQLPEGALIGEIEEFAGGTQETATFTLEAGSYVFFCNIVEEEEDGELEAHFEEGMFTVVTVS